MKALPSDSVSPPIASPIRPPRGRGDRQRGGWHRNRPRESGEAPAMLSVCGLRRSAGAALAMGASRDGMAVRSTICVALALRGTAPRHSK
jgi:hypothetical protein